MDKVCGETLHRHISNYMRAKIYAKEWSLGERIPSEHEFMSRFEVSRGTVRKAIKTLVDEGLLEQEHGRGTFVCAPERAYKAGDKPFSFAASLVEQGIPFTTHVLTHAVIPANAEIAEKLQMDVGGPVFKMRRVRKTNGKPIMVHDSWVDLEVCPGLDKLPLENMSLFHAIEQTSGAKIESSRMDYSARAAGNLLSDALEIAQGSPILNLEQVIVLDDGRPAEWGDTMLCAGQRIVGTVHQN